MPNRRLILSLALIRANCYNNFKNRRKTMIFKKILLFAMFATAAGFCFADPCAPYAGADGVVITQVDCDSPPEVQAAAPVWPLVGSDADIHVTNTATGTSNVIRNDDNIRIVSKIGADLTVENNINIGSLEGYSFSGGANMTHPFQAPPGFNTFEGRSEMPLMHVEMLEDDGGQVLAMSRSGRSGDRYRELRSRGALTCDGNTCTGPNGMVCTNGVCTGLGGFGEMDYELYDMEVDSGTEFDTSPADVLSEQVRSWVVASGQTLRGVLQDWSDKEGWDLVWGTAREYPIEASAVFKGRFVDVASALVRNFGRATPVPYAKFYKGNRVLVITADEGN